MGIKIFRLLKLFSFYVGLLAVLIAFVPGLPPDIHFEAYEPSPSIDLEKLPIVNALDKVEVILEGETSGAESPTVIGQGDGFYAGLDNGQIVKYQNGIVSVVAQVGRDCGAPWGSVCGRPLGLRLDASGKLVVSAADRGVLIVDPKKGDVSSLFDFKSDIQGHVPGFADDLDVGQNGTVYWSDVSTNLDVMNPLKDLLGNDPSGRLVEYDPKTKRNKVLIDAIHFANGVQLSENEDFVLVSESIRCRVLRYHLKGPKAGQKDVFMDGLPGLPDNIRPNGKGGFYIVLSEPRQFLGDNIGKLPTVRKLILRTHTLVDLMAGSLKRFIPDFVDFGGLSQIVLNTIPVQKISAAIAGPSRILDVDAAGKILRVLQHSENKISFASQIVISSKYAYIGRFFGNGIWRIKMSDLK